MLVPYRVAAIHSSGKQGGTTDLFYLPLHRRDSVQGQFCFQAWGRGKHENEPDERTMASLNL
jgi:hypothetical protein